MIKLLFDISDLPTKIKRSIDYAEHDIAPFHTVAVSVERGEDFTIPQHFDLWKNWMEGMGYDMKKYNLVQFNGFLPDNPCRGHCTCDSSDESE